MQFHRFGIFMVMTAVVAIPAVALAGGETLTADSPSDTGISGLSGTDVILEPDANAFLIGTEWSERGDDPCFFRATSLAIKSGTGAVVTKQWNANCAEKPASRKSISVFHPGGDTSEFRAIRSIQICTSQKKSSDAEKLKGIRVWMSRVSVADAKVTPEDSMEHEDHTNCKTWQNRVDCPANQVATGLKLTYLGQRVRGAGLRCARVKSGAAAGPTAAPRKGGRGR